MISLYQPDIGPEEEALVLDVLRSRQLAQGPLVERLETEFARIADAPHVIAVNNGTTALVASLLALRIGPGDEVITSPFTFVATLNAILAVGASARFADIGPDFNVVPGNVEALINERTALILPVDLFGQMADLPALAAIAAEHSLALVEDAAQAHGADVDGRRAGSFGLGCFSLYATKNLTAGEGGLITTHDAQIADRLRLLRNQGMRARYAYEAIGANYRMTDVHAAIALPQLDRLEGNNGRRRRNAALLSEGLEDVEGLMLPTAEPGRGHVWHQYTVRVTPQARLTRAELHAALTARGIDSGVYYPKAVCDYACFEDHPLVVHDDVPVARETASQVLSLPVHPFLDPADIDTIVAALRDALRA